MTRSLKPPFAFPPGTRFEEFFDPESDRIVGVAAVPTLRSDGSPGVRFVGADGKTRPKFSLTWPAKEMSREEWLAKYVTKDGPDGA